LYLRLLIQRLLAQLIQVKLFFLHLNVVTQKENKREMKEEEKTKENFKGFFWYSQASSPEGYMIEDENIQTIFIHTNRFF